METSYFLSRDIVIPTLGEGMSMWREKLFASMHRNAAAAADFLNLPDQPRGRARREGRDLGWGEPGHAAR